MQQSSTVIRGHQSVLNSAIKGMFSLWLKPVSLKVMFLNLFVKYQILGFFIQVKKNEVKYPSSRIHRMTQTARTTVIGVFCIVSSHIYHVSIGLLSFLSLLDFINFRPLNHSFYPSFPMCATSEGRAVPNRAGPTMQAEGGDRKLTDTLRSRDKSRST